MEKRIKNKANRKINTEGIYTKLASIAGILALLIPVYYLIPKPDKKLDGEWEMTSIIKEADSKDFIGLKIKWKMFISEQENRVKGSAEKIEINNKSLNYQQRTTINFEGNIKGKVMTLNYSELGKKRITTGIIIVQIKDNEFLGNFSQSASTTRGLIQGKRRN